MTIEELDLDPPGTREVQVRLTAAGVCHSDLHYINGDLMCRLPAVLGHEGTGVVESVGPEVRNASVGDTVVLTWRPRCGRCDFCTSGRPGLCTTSRTETLDGNLPDGESRLHRHDERINHFLAASCFAEACVVSEDSVVVIPSTVPPEVAALLGCAAITGFGAVLNVMDRVQGKSVLVLGAGGVGLSAIMAAKSSGAAPIIAVDVAPQSGELARALGATHVILAGPDMLANVRAVLPEGVDWAIDAVGSSDTLAQTVSALKRGGTAIALGLTKVGAEVSLAINDLVQNEKRVIGSLYGSANTPVQIPALISMYESGLAPVDRLLGQSFPLDRINDAFDSMREGAPGRAVIVFSGNRR